MIVSLSEPIVKPRTYLAFRPTSTVSCPERFESRFTLARTNFHTCFNQWLQPRESVRRKKALGSGSVNADRAVRNRHDVSIKYTAVKLAKRKQKRDIRTMCIVRVVKNKEGTENSRERRTKKKFKYIYV